MIKAPGTLKINTAWQANWLIFSRQFYSIAT